MLMSVYYLEQFLGVNLLICILSFRGGTLKKVKALKVLEGKAAQNLSILLGGSLKHLSYQVGTT